MLAPLPSVSAHAPLIHQIRSPHQLNAKVLLILDYDYFLTRRDLRLLVQAYQRLILVPVSTRPAEHLEQLLKPFTSVTLVSRPGSWQPSKSFFQLKRVQVSTLTDFCEQTLGKVYIASQPTIPSLQASLLGFSPRTRLMKKGVDVFISTPILLLSSPLWLYSAWKIRKQSPGPVFYQQERIGWQK